MLEAIDLVCVRGTRLLFAPVSLCVKAGQAVWVRGENGAGKTSLLRLLSGLAQPWSGEVRWRGERIDRDRSAWHRGLRYLGHQPPVKDELTTLENLRYTARLAGRPCALEQALEALRRMGLADLAALPARGLSQGQRRRLGLAQLALDPQPDVLILDEPFDALDDVSCARLKALLADRLQQGAALVFTSHLSLDSWRVAPLQLWLEAARAC